MIRFQHNIAVCLVAAALFPGATAYAGESASQVKQRIGSGDTVAGNAESSLCQGCHGVDGISFVELIPNLAGQDAPYIVKQLRDFQSGARTHQIMSAISNSVSETEMADIAAYFASRKIMQGDRSGDNPVAKKLFLKGDPVRGITPCMSCHGANGKTPRIASYPVIGGQHKEYLRVQLIHWRNGDRSNSPDGVMNKAAKSLTDAEIESLSGFLSGL